MAERCPRQFCGGRLEATTDGNGRGIVACPRCARNRRGLCAECPRSLPTPDSRRCRSCTKRRHAATRNRKYRTDPAWRERRCASSRKTYWNNPAYRARQLARFKHQPAKKRDAISNMKANINRRRRLSDPVKHAAHLAWRRDRYRKRKAADPNYLDTVREKRRARTARKAQSQTHPEHSRAA